MSSEFTFVCKVPDPPCRRDCAMRNEYCHAKCEAYQKWYEDSLKRKEEVREKRSVEGMLNGIKKEGARKSRERIRKSRSGYRG